MLKLDDILNIDEAGKAASSRKFLRKRIVRDIESAVDQTEAAVEEQEEKVQQLELAIAQDGGVTSLIEAKHKLRKLRDALVTVKEVKEDLLGESSKK